MIISKQQSMKKDCREHRIECCIPVKTKVATTITPNRLNCLSDQKKKTTQKIDVDDFEKLSTNPIKKIKLKKPILQVTIKTKKRSKEF